MRSLAPLLLVIVTAAGCGGDGVPATATSTAASSTSTPTEQRYPDVIAVDVRADGRGTFSFDVTISSPYDTAERYADAWRVVGPDGTVYEVRELTHDHAGEQPFTRSLDDVAIPGGTTLVTVQARDKINGWGGSALDIAIPSADGG